MKKRSITILYNSPVILTFALLSLLALGLGKLTDGWTTQNLFCVYRSPLTDWLTYPRFFLHVLGHPDFAAYCSNIVMLLVVGPTAEERFGGKRILLERIPRLWGRFSFNTKMIIRNIFRNKGRSFLSLVGILCCNMLIICSFGLQESINTFIDDYYTHTLRYDVRANLISGQASSLDHYRETLNAMKVDGIMEQSVSLRSETNLRSCLLTVMTDDQTSIALGDNATFLTLPRTGTAISRKLSGLMNVGLGDTVSICLT